MSRNHKPILAERFKTKTCENFEREGNCPYESRCMFAHGEKELRTKQMNLTDNLVTEEAIKAFQKARVIAARSAQKKKEQDQLRKNRRGPTASAQSPGGADASGDGVANMNFNTSVPRHHAMVSVHVRLQQQPTQLQKQHLNQSSHTPSTTPVTTAPPTPTPQTKVVALCQHDISTYVAAAAAHEAALRMESPHSMHRGTPTPVHSALACLRETPSRCVSPAMTGGGGGGMPGGTVSPSLIRMLAGNIPSPAARPAQPPVSPSMMAASVTGHGTPPPMSLSPASAGITPTMGGGAPPPIRRRSSMTEGGSGRVRHDPYNMSGSGLTQSLGGSFFGGAGAQSGGGNNTSFGPSDRGAASSSSPTMMPAPPGMLPSHMPMLPPQLMASMPSSQAQ